MYGKQSPKQRFLEITLVLICVALSFLLCRLAGHRMVVLNLFYLPIVLAAFFLGRYRAGVLALLCVVAAAVATALGLGNFAVYSSPLVIGLALTIWGAVLGLTAILVGTLSDERSRKIEELHDAYVGVVEVLSRYLNSADAKLNHRATKMAELSQKVAAHMRLSEKEIDDIRVAALLQDMENIEVTAKVIRKAIGDLTPSAGTQEPEHTFHGSELAQSLGSVLTGALPLLFDQSNCLDLDQPEDGLSASGSPPIAARIMYSVRRYVTLWCDDTGMAAPHEVLNALKDDPVGDHHPAVLHALAEVVLDSPNTASTSPQENAPECSIRA